MIDLLRQMTEPMPMAAIVSYVAVLKREASRLNALDSIKDIPAASEVPSVLRALERAGKAKQNERGKWEAVPEKPAVQKPRDKQKGLFDD